MKHISDMHSFDVNKYKSNLLFVPLGGSNELGLNVNLYHYMGKWLMIDCGNGFLDKKSNEILLPDLTFIEQHKHNLLGLIITHVHEDHLGAIEHVWHKLRCQIFGTPFAVNILRSKLKNCSFYNEVKINEIIPKTQINLNPFILETIPLPHSTAEMQAILIQTKVGNIFHTGDWKFDDNPVIGEIVDENLLKTYNDKGILAVVSDSTNIFDTSQSGSEGNLAKSLQDIISHCPEMVLVTTYSSNLARISTLIKIAQNINRKIIIIGDDMLQTLLLSQKCGYLIDIKGLINENQISEFKRKDILVIASGCNGEKNESIAQVAANQHPNIKLLSGDTVIFSSKITARNEEAIDNLVCIFSEAKIQTITEANHFVHVQGHATTQEIKKMYDLLQPKICIPVHGTQSHICAHAKFASKIGVKHTFNTKNGDVILLNQTSPRIVGKVLTGFLPIDSCSTN